MDRKDIFYGLGILLTVVLLAAFDSLRYRNYHYENRYYTVSYDAWEWWVRQSATLATLRWASLIFFALSIYARLGLITCGRMIAGGGKFGGAGAAKKW